MLSRLKTWLGRSEPVPDDRQWQAATDLPTFHGLSADDLARLRALAAELLTDKSFSAAGGLQLDAAMCFRIAALAALPILNLGYPSYRGWREIIVYPGEFVPERQEVDDAGVVHHVRHPMSGESWDGGPIVLSWADVEASGWCEGYNVVIHEFAHKLDMRNGAVNGHPPLHAGMRDEDWAAALGAAYAEFCARVDAGAEGSIDPYAAESPAEFFAVLSEYFFEWPEAVASPWPAVYEQLRRFYLQDPLSRLERTDDPATP